MRRQMNKNVDDLFERLGRRPIRPNTVTPEILVGPIWYLPDNEPSNVEIIELNSSNEEEVSPADTNNRDNKSHAWSYVSDNCTQQSQDTYKINAKARERHRLQNAELTALAPSYAATDLNDSFVDNFYNSDGNFDEKLTFNHQMNCFTIINKHFIDSDTSTEGEYGDVEIMTSKDVVMDNKNWEPHNNNFYNEEVITYNTDLDQEPRTIWIYSFKNKHLLADDEFEREIPNKETSSSSTSYSTDSSSEQTRDKSTSSCRIGSPIPPAYVPRLDLSLVPTLSTVTEISESNTHPQPTPNESTKSTSRAIKRSTNNWFISESAKLESGRCVRKHEKSTNIINWMGLSPRERRRVIKDKSLSDTWIDSHLHLADLCTDDKENHGDQTNVIVQNHSVKVHVDVEVHTDTNVEKNENIKLVELKSAGAAVKSNMESVRSINKVQFPDAAYEDFQKDRGDHDSTLPVAPTIRLTPKSRRSNDISDPIEKLDNSNWIRDTKDEIETNVYDYVLDKSESMTDGRTADNSVDHLWMKNNVPFLKPSQWTEFMPIADSPVSYHLSLGSIIEERQTWYRRLINFLKCCK